jgi:hypothetical protein
VTVFVVIMIVSCEVLLHGLVVASVRGVDGKLAFVSVIDSLSLIIGTRLVRVFCAQAPVGAREDELDRYIVLISEIRVRDVMHSVIMISDLVSFAEIDCSCSG